MRKLFCHVAVACTALLLSSCGHASSETTPAASGVAPVPLVRAEAMEYFLASTKKLCAREGFLELTRTSGADCLAYIEKVQPICDEEGLAAMPAEFADEAEARRYGQTYVRCLAPPLVK